MQKNDGYNLVFISRKLRMAWRPLKRWMAPQLVSNLKGAGTYLLPYISRRLRIFGSPRYTRKRTIAPLLSSGLSWKRPKRGNARKRPLWRFFRPKHLLGYNPPQVISNIIGAGTYALPYVRRRPRIFFRPRHHLLLPPPPPIPQFILNDPDWWRIRRRSWFVNAARFVILGPPSPIQRKPRPTIRFKQKRPLWRFFRPRHLISPPGPQPAVGPTGAGTYALPYISRRLRIQRPRHLLPIQVTRSQPLRSRPTIKFRQRRPLSFQFFRTRHVLGFSPTPPPTPSAFILKRQPPRRRARQLLRWFFRPKHLYPALPAVSALRQFRAPLRLKQKRPLWRFFRPRHVLGFNPQPPTSFFPRKPGPRPRIRRARINVLRFKKNMFAFSFTPPPPPTGHPDWLTRYRRRGRR